MRIGHRRTQSSHLANETREEANPSHNYSHAHRRSEVCRLLDESEAKIKEKVYSVDTLSSEPKQQKGSLFNFGKGLLSHAEIKQKQRNAGPLVAIPQKPKPNSAKGKRTPETEGESLKKPKMRKTSLVKITLREKERTNPQPHEQMARIMKIKIGPIQAKPKKPSLYLTEKPVPKNVNFKKEISHAK